ncbi:unnamed protein product [Diabrotica balteata]|uniref:ZAD domain-containing protein n=1 Tax=Diabrotica balteata TaxID=107213 RepID=A0A9N9TDP7_DIABA|nr:unnamed protein product [Diabrotica balteata]
MPFISNGDGCPRAPLRIRFTSRTGAYRCLLKMAYNNIVCRLCLSEKELNCVFKNNSNKVDLQEVIFITTGVQILENDIISRKICLNCSNTVIKIQEFREISINSDRYLKEKCIEHLKVAEIKIPNTDVTITTRKRHIKEKQDDPSTSVPEKTDCNILSQNKLDVSKEEESDDYSHNSNIPMKVTVHESVSKLFALYPNLKLRTGVLVFDLNPFVSLELDAVEKYCDDNNINLKLTSESVDNVNIADQKTIPKNNFSDLNFCSETNILEDKESFTNPQSNHATLRMTRFRIKQVDILNKFKVGPIRTTRSNNPSKFNIIPEDSFKRSRESSKSEVSVTDTQQSNLKRRKLLSSDFISNTDNICYFYCSFCKAKFRDIEYRLCHEQKCTVGQALNSKPYVELIKVDLDLKIRKKYLLHDTISDQKQVSPNEVIELFNNDQSLVDSTIVTNIATEPNNVVNVENKFETESKNHIDNCNTFSQTIDTLGNKEPLPQIGVSNTPNGVVPANVLPLQYLSTAIVRPTIILRNDSLLNDSNMCGSDIALLKELIQNSKRILRKDPLMQTVASKDITQTWTVKNMFSQLRLYKVPIKIRCGAHSISSSTPEIKIEKEVDIWHDIKPIILINTNSMVDINKTILRPSGIVLTNSLRTNKKDSSLTIKTGSLRTNKKTILLKRSISSQTPQNIGNGVKMKISRIISSTQKKNKVCSQNISSTQSSATITPSNSVQTVFSQNSGTIITNVYNQTQVNLPQTLNSSINTTNNYTEQIFTPNLLNNTSNVQQIFIPANNTLTSHGSHLQILSHTLNNAVVNNIDNNSQQMYIPLSSNSINSTNCISQVFGSSSGTVMPATNQSSILIPVTNPMVPDGSIPNLNVINPLSNVPNQITPLSTVPNQITPLTTIPNQITPVSTVPNQITPLSTVPNHITPLSTVPNQTNVGFTYSYSNNTQNAVSLVNNPPILVNSPVPNCNVTSSIFASNEVQQNMLGTVNFTPNNMTDTFSTSVVQCQTSAISNNFSLSQPIIRVKNIYELN